MPGHCFREVLRPVVLGEMGPCSELHEESSSPFYGPCLQYGPVASSVFLLTTRKEQLPPTPPPHHGNGNHLPHRANALQPGSAPEGVGVGWGGVQPPPPPCPFSETTKGRPVRASKGNGGCFLATEHPRVCMPSAWLAQELPELRQGSRRPLPTLWLEQRETR